MSHTAATTRTQASIWHDDTVTVAVAPAPPFESFHVDLTHEHGAVLLTLSREQLQRLVTASVRVLKGHDGQQHAEIVREVTA